MKRGKTGSNKHRGAVSPICNSNLKVIFSQRAHFWFKIFTPLPILKQIFYNAAASKSTFSGKHSFEEEASDKINVFTLFTPWQLQILVYFALF